MQRVRCRRLVAGRDSVAILESLEPVLKLIGETKRAHAANRALLAGLSGIDGSGKSHVARKLVARLTEAGFKVALIGVDDWLNPSLNHSQVIPGEFYAKGVRFADLF